MNTESTIVQSKCLLTANFLKLKIVLLVSVVEQNSNQRHGLKGTNVATNLFSELIILFYAHLYLSWDISKRHLIKISSKFITSQCVLKQNILCRVVIHMDEVLKTGMKTKAIRTVRCKVVSLRFSLSAAGDRQKNL